MYISSQIQTFNLCCFHILLNRVELMSSNPVVSESFHQYVIPLFSFSLLAFIKDNLCFPGITGWGTDQKNPIGWFAIPAKTHHATPKNVSSAIFSSIFAPFVFSQFFFMLSPNSKFGILDFYITAFYPCIQQLQKLPNIRVFFLNERKHNMTVEKQMSAVSLCSI